MVVRGWRAAHAAHPLIYRAAMMLLYSPGTLDLDAASQVIDDSCYHISFTDADTGTWDGTGLRLAPGGKKLLRISRKTCNASGKVVGFLGCGAQVSTNLHGGPMAGIEANFFFNRSRSMIVVLYRKASEPRAGAAAMTLNSVAVAPFRCAFGCDVPRTDTVTPLPELLAAVAGWAGQEQSYPANRVLEDEGEWRAVADPFAPSHVLNLVPEPRIAKAFRDGLFFVGPPTLVPGVPVRWVVGVRHSGGGPFKVLVIDFDAQGDRVGQTLREYRPVPAGLQHRMHM